MGGHMAAFEVIDIRSFSNLWFWMVLAVMWSSASHRVIGIPYDMIQNAKRHGGRAEHDLEALMQINAQRFFDMRSRSGLTVIGLGCAGLSSLGLLGFSYQIELAQAVFLLAFPISIIATMNLRTAALVRACDGISDGLYRRFRRHRMMTQLLAVGSIFVTATWGMYHNISHALLGGIN